MALSMFLRTSACTNRMFSQQIMRMATQPVFAQKAVTSSLPVLQHMKDARTTPILNTLRTFQTSPALLGEKGHNHAKLWVIEKSVSGLLVPLIPLGLLLPNRILDSVLAILITAHSFWGLEAIAVDYVRASIFGPVIPKIAIAIVYLISFATLGGLFYLITHDVGLCNAVRQLWSVKANEHA